MTIFYSAVLRAYIVIKSSQVTILQNVQKALMMECF